MFSLFLPLVGTATTTTLAFLAPFRVKHNAACDSCNHDTLALL